MKRKSKPTDPLGRYYTPASVAQQCVDLVLPWFFGHAQPRSILEPSAGRGVFLAPLRRAFPLASIRAMDLAPAPDAVQVPGVDPIERHDFLEYNFATTYDLVCGNPPFKQAEQFCLRAMALSPVVVYLLRLGFLASAKRAGFWRQYPANRVFVLPKRPSFQSDGHTDRYDYAFFGWQAGAYGCHLHWLPLPGGAEVYQ